MGKPVPYYSLLTRDDAGAKWGVQFGSYEWIEAIQELELAEAYRDYFQLALIITGDEQQEITEVVNSLNCKLEGA